MLTYGDVQDLANRTGNALRELGIGPRSACACCCLDAPEFLGAFWGAIKIGAVPIPTNTLMRTDDYVYFLSDSRATRGGRLGDAARRGAPVLARRRSCAHVLWPAARPGRISS